MRPIPLILLLAACSTEPNHLGNPLTLPVGALTTAAENAVYDAKRRKVANYIATHADALRAGTGYAALYDIAGTPPHFQDTVRTQIMALPPGDFTESATVITMVHGA